MKIQEFIVVEGKDDTVAIKRAVEADTIETNGSAINEKTIQRIKHAQQKRGVIVFTDPDYPGRRIRAIIEQHVPNVKHAFLPKNKAIAKNGNGLGVEHASNEAIIQALKEIYTPNIDHIEEIITREDLMLANLLGNSQAKARRARLGEILMIGETNAKQLHKRLQMFQISAEEFGEAVTQLNLEEQHE